MKIFKLMTVAFVAMLGFAACDKDCGHDFIEHDFTKELVGTWTYLAGNGQAEAMVIKTDGSFTTTGVMLGGSLYEEKGTIKVVNNKVTLAFDGDNETFEGRLEFVAGKSMSIVMFNDNDVRLDYDYCENDLSDEILGMWVCNDGPSDKETDMVIQTFNEDGTVTKTGWSVASNEFIVQDALTYKVVGDLLFHQRPSDMVTEGVAANFASKLTYMSNANQLGDMLTNTAIKLVNGQAIELSMSMLRIKQSLDLTGKTYDYSSAYVSNAKGKDEEFSMLGHTFNMANIAGHNFNMLFRSELFSVDLNANSITQRFRANGRDIEIVIPITVDDNKVSLDLSAENPAYRKVDMYMFQDADNSQLHMYMHTNDFINYFANMELYNLLASGEIDKTDAAAIEKVYTDMEARIESINVSFIFKARK